MPNQFKAHMTEEHVAEGVAKYFSGPVLAGADLQRYCMGPSSPTGESGRPPLHLCE